jgi:hypothetical protein
MRFPLLSFIGTLLAALAIARMAALVLHEPMLAFANQYDMVRTGACVGLYPDLPQPKRDIATPAAPLERYTLGARNATACYWGTEALLAGLVVAKQRVFGAPGAAFAALRQLGILKLVIAAFAIAAFAAAFWPYPAVALLHGGTALLVLADPVVTLWFQTLYAEFPIFFGIYLLIASLVASLLREAMPWRYSGAAAAGIVLAAYAKEQFFLLPLVLVAVAAPRLWATSRRELAALAVVALGASLWHHVMPRDASIAQANRADTYLATLLPASAHLPETLAHLDLPERCGDLSGASWYLPRGEDLNAACPEALALPSTAFLRLAIPEPLTLARALVRAAPTTQYPLLGNIGVIAGMQWGTLDMEPAWVQSVLARAAALVAARWYLAIVLVACASIVPAAVLWTATLVRGANAHAHPYAAYALMLALVVVYALGTSVFGDGLGETARHNLAGLLAMGAMIPAAIAGFALAKDVTLGVRVAVAVSALAAVALAAIATYWAWRQPLALGQLDTPLTLQVPREGFHLRGWAIDPIGVSSVIARSGAHALTVPKEQMLASPAVAAVYGAYPAANSAYFDIPVPADWLTQPEVRFRVEVQNAFGVVTEIDRRRVLPAQ